MHWLNPQSRVVTPPPAPGGRRRAASCLQNGRSPNPTRQNIEQCCSLQVQCLLKPRCCPDSTYHYSPLNWWRVELCTEEPSNVVFDEALECLWCLCRACVVRSSIKCSVWQSHGVLVCGLVNQNTPWPNICVQKVANMAFSFSFSFIWTSFNDQFFVNIEIFWVKQFRSIFRHLGNYE